MIARGNLLGRIAGLAAYFSASRLRTKYGGTGQDFSATAQGNILYFSAAGVLTSLAPGTSGQLLQTQGTSANPQWATIAFDTLVAKAADETINNSAVLQNDDHLVYAMLANTIYSVEVHLLLNAPSTTSDFKFGWTVPAACTMFWGPMESGSGVGGHDAIYWCGASPGLTQSALLTESGTLTQASINGTFGLIIYAIVRNGANAGNLQLQWAQNTGTVEDSKVLKDSFMRVRKIQ